MKVAYEYSIHDGEAHGNAINSQAVFSSDSDTTRTTFCDLDVNLYSYGAHYKANSRVFSQLYDKYVVFLSQLQG